MNEEPRRTAVVQLDGRRNEVGASAARSDLVRDMRLLADFLENHPDVPVPRIGDVQLSVFADGTDAEQRAQVDAVGMLIDAAVIDNTDDGGHYLTSLRFGCAEYRFISIPQDWLEPSREFSAGQEVRLTGALARAYRRSGLPQAGVVIARMDHDSGEKLYTVRTPGRITLQVPGQMLEPVRLTPAVTSRGAIATMADAETLLVEALATCRVSRMRGEVPARADAADVNALSQSLGSACGLDTAALTRMLATQISIDTKRMLCGSLKSAPLSPARRQDPAVHSSRRRR